MPEERTGSSLALEAIGVSVTSSLTRLANSDLASLVFAQSYFEARHGNGPAIGTEIPSKCRELTEEAVHNLVRDRRRYTLLAAIGIFDSFLSDALRFCFLEEPSVISQAIPAKTVEKLERKFCSPEERVEEIVRRHMVSWRRRFEFLCEHLSVAFEPGTVEELARLVDLRNEVAHHVGLYDFVVDTRDQSIYARPRRIPEVHSADSQASMMIVTEITNKIFVAVSKQLFGDLPATRPLTPAVEAVHRKLRESRDERSKREKQAEYIADPGWSVRQEPDSDFVWVGERTGNWMIVPTLIDQKPALLSFLRNNRHGTNASARVDENPQRELVDSKELLEEMLSGQEVAVEFYEEPYEDSKQAAYSLNGFSSAWKAACEERANLTRGEEELST